MKLKQNLIKALLCLGAVAAQGAWASTPDKKIVVLSDPHVMAPDLLVASGDAWTNYLAGQRKMVDYSKPLFDAMVKKIKEEIQPDLVLITGDLTKDGEQISHTYVIGKLDELREQGIPTLVIPGNHDRGSNSNAVSYNGASTSAVDVASDAWFATQYANYGYGTTSERNGSSLTYACEPIAGLVVIGIDSGTGGSVSSSDLTWIVGKATAARAKGKRVIAMMHHPLIPHFLGVDKYVDSAVINDYETVRNTLADAGIKVIFTGHFHTSDIAKDWNADNSREIYDVNTGSLISYPCDYRVVTISGDLSEMSLTTGHITSLSDDASFTSEYAKGRLQSSMEDRIASKGTAYAMIKTHAAQAFIYHAEGNENGSSGAASTLTMLTSAANLAKTYGFATAEQAQEMTDMATSMLQDISNYGTTRADQTDDLALDLELPASIKLADDGYSTYCSENKLDISLTDGLTAYIVTGITATTVTMTSVNVIPASTGFVIKGTGGNIYDLYKSTDDADDVASNLLHGTLVATTAPANTYVLSTQTGNTGFYPATTGIQIPAHKAYLTITSSGARTIDFSSGATGIETIENQEQNCEFYNLQGMKVAHPRKGVYVNRGKLVIIK